MVPYQTVPYHQVWLYIQTDFELIEQSMFLCWPFKMTKTPILNLVSIAQVYYFKPDWKSQLKTLTVTKKKCGLDKLPASDHG